MKIEARFRRRAEAGESLLELNGVLLNRLSTVNGLWKDSRANESRRTGRDVDGRDTVFRIHPISYFDSIMCVRAFGISADEVVSRLAGFIACSEHLHAGALLIISNEPIAGEQLLALDVSIRRRLMA